MLALNNETIVKRWFFFEIKINKIWNNNNNNNKNKNKLFNLVVKITVI